MKVLVTGAAGFIGAATCQKLLERGDNVLGVDNLNSYYDVSLKEARLKLLTGRENFSFQKLDLADRESLSKSIREFKPDRVLHLAAQAGVRYSLENPFAYMDANLVGFLNLIEEVRHLEVEHFVFASSSSVYGANTKMPFSPTDNVDHPVSLYAATKKSNELIAHCYSHLFNIPTTGLRFFTVYGPMGRPDMALFKFTKKILARETIDVYHFGKCKRDFTYVDDIVEGVIRVLDRPAGPNPEWDSLHPDPASSSAPYRIYNIGNHSPVELSYFIEVLEKELGVKAKKNLMALAPGDVPETYADVSSLEKAVGFKPSTSIETGVSRFVNWYREYYRV